MYKVAFLPDAEKSFKQLDTTIQKRIAAKIDWLAENADLVIHHPLKSLPDDLRGLCRIRIGGLSSALLDLCGDKTNKGL
jgi:mRNA-degrading endonuclease RelE of RelBE toxin-antitoxin system